MGTDTIFDFSHQIATPSTTSILFRSLYSCLTSPLVIPHPLPPPLPFPYTLIKYFYTLELDPIEIRFVCSIDVIVHRLRVRR